MCQKSISSPQRTQSYRSLALKAAVGHIYIATHAPFTAGDFCLTLPLNQRWGRNQSPHCREHRAIAEIRFKSCSRSEYSHTSSIYSRGFLPDTPSLPAVGQKSISSLLSSTSRFLQLLSGAGISLLVERPTEKPGAILTRVRVPCVARDVSTRVSSQCRFFYRVRTDPVCNRICVHDKNR